VLLQLAALSAPDSAKTTCYCYRIAAAAAAAAVSASNGTFSNKSHFIHTMFVHQGACRIRVPGLAVTPAAAGDCRTVTGAVLPQHFRRLATQRSTQMHQQAVICQVCSSSGRGSMCMLDKAKVASRSMFVVYKAATGYANDINRHLQTFEASSICPDAHQQKGTGFEANSLFAARQFSGELPAYENQLLAL
jgi:hypothetical protein